MEELTMDDLESCTMVRFPEDIAAQLHEHLVLEEEEWKNQFQSDSRVPISRPLDSRLNIKLPWNTDKRHCTIKWDDKQLRGRLCDLPTILETYKTTDKKTFYKTSTISQMIVCAHNDREINPRNEKHGPKDDRRFQMLAGLAPPLKNVKKRRFRKVIRKRHCEAPEVEKELKRLLREDLDPSVINVEYELVDDPDYGAGKKGKSKDDSHQDIHELFNQLSSSDDDDKEEVDLTQHLTWDLTGLHGDKIRRLQDEATKLVEQLNKNKIRRQKKEAELEAAHKEEKKERLRQEIEETRRKEQDKTNAYIECVKKKEKKY